MSKFKKGDRVKCVTQRDHIYVGAIGTVDQDDNENPFVVWDDNTINKQGCNGKSCISEKKIELITDYQPITPKVGEKYRVMKECEKNGVTKLNDYYIGSIVEVTGESCHRDCGGDERGISLQTRWANILTTEYLELVEEPLAETPYQTNLKHGQIVCIGEHGLKKEPIKQPNLIKKSMNFIKKLTQSADDKTLEKAGFMDSCGELTGTGSDALESLIFAEKKAELVKLANEMIAEREAQK